MSVALGLNAWIGLGEESTWGTPVTATKFLEIYEADPKLNQKALFKQTLGNPSRRYAVKSKRDAGGSFKLPMIYQGAEYILKHALGSVASAQIGVTGVYTHTFSLATALPTGLTVVCNRDTDAIGGSNCFRYEGGQISKLSFDAQLEDFLLCEVEFEAEDEALFAKPTPSFPTFKGISWEDMTTFTVGGTAFAAEMLQLSIENPLATDRHKLTSRLRKGLGRASHRMISGKLAIEFESTTEYAFFQSLGTAGALVANYVGPIAAGSTPYGFRIAATNVILQGDTPPVKDAGPIKMEIPFDLPIADGGAANSEFSIAVDNLLTAVT